MDIELNHGDVYTISQYLNAAAKGYEAAKIDLADGVERNDREIALLTHLNGDMDAQAAKARDLALKFECSEGATLLDVELD